MRYIKEWHDNFRRIRQERGLHQSQMAELLGVSQAMVALWESCQRRFTEDMLLLIAEKCEISLESLIALKPGPNDFEAKTEGMWWRQYND